jgi:hypothetical protein
MLCFPGRGAGEVGRIFQQPVTTKLQNTRIHCTPKFLGFCEMPEDPSVFWFLILAGGTFSLCLGVAEVLRKALETMMASGQTLLQPCHLDKP